MVNETTCLAMYRFKILFDNEQYTSSLLVELSNNKEYKKSYFSMHENSKEIIHGWVLKSNSRSEL